MTKRLLLAGLLALAPVAAFGASSVLTSKGVLYSIEKGDGASVLLERRSGDSKLLVVIPSTVDDARDDRAQLEYDRASDRLYVIWVREGKTSDVMMSWLDSNGEWADSQVISSAPGLVQHDELRTAVSRITSNGVRTTLVHIASWIRDGQVLFGDYALVAFEGGERVSTYNTNFQLLDARTNPNSGDQEDMVVLNPFPALALAATGDGVDLVYGYEQGTAVTRLHITPRLEPNARAWKPLGRTIGSLPPAHFAANSVEPVKALFSRDRVVLYTDQKMFRFVVFEGGNWSETRELALDDKLTGEALLSQLRRFLDDEYTPDDPVISR